MPIVIKNPNFSQTSSKICFEFPVKGANKENADIFKSKKYLKLNSSPFFFECFFPFPVQPETGSKIRFEDNRIFVELLKESAGHWDDFSLKTLRLVIT